MRSSSECQGPGARRCRARASSRQRKAAVGAFVPFMRGGRRDARMSRASVRAQAAHSEKHCGQAAAPGHIQAIAHLVSGGAPLKPLLVPPGSSSGSSRRL
eukprot:12814168-Alexandrium_andersonii.AAC.1